MVAIVNYGMGNLGSIQNMLRKIGVEALITSDATIIDSATKIILPGVGAFDTGMRNLHHLDLIPLLNDKVLNRKTPVLGICLGVQLMTQSSEEGKQPGLGWFAADTIKFNIDKVEEKLLLPNIGWRDVVSQKSSQLIGESSEDMRYYFVHSYHLLPKQSEDVLMTSFYGYDYVVALEKDNILGVQFHPEKSHKYGMQLLRNFVNNY